MALLRRMDTSGIFCSLRRLSRTQGMVATMVLPDMSWVSHFSLSRFFFCGWRRVISRDDDFFEVRMAVVCLNRGSHISTHVTGEGHMMVLGLDTRGSMELVSVGWLKWVPWITRPELSKLVFKKITGCVWKTPWRYVSSLYFWRIRPKFS